MNYLVRFEDNAHLADQRARHMQDHLAFLDRNAALIRGAGPLQDGPSGLPDGGLWLVEADRDEDVWALIREDPLWETGLRRSVQLLRWNRVR